MSLLPKCPLYFKRYTEIVINSFLFGIVDTTGEENSIRKSVNRELMLTSHFVDDAYDLANSSHKRDEEVLKHASQAIVSTIHIYMNDSSSGGNHVI